MSSHTDSYHILLTYKGKFLLIQQENLTNTGLVDSWHFIKIAKSDNALAEKTIIQEVLNETQIHLDNVTFLAKRLQENTMHHLFHAKLSDENVNSINRAEGRLLQFFRLGELVKLKLAPSTELFFLDKSISIDKLLAS